MAKNTFLIPILLIGLISLLIIPIMFRSPLIYQITYMNKDNPYDWYFSLSQDGFLEVYVWSEYKGITVWLNIADANNQSLGWYRLNWQYRLINQTKIEPILFTFNNRTYWKFFIHLPELAKGKYYLILNLNMDSQTLSTYKAVLEVKQKWII
ncbi:MAG: hypothetical protein QXT31_03960 [Candidatus Bathyarchaeia archaeon]